MNQTQNEEACCVRTRRSPVKCCEELRVICFGSFGISKARKRSAALGLLLDWAAVARKLGKIPTVTEYESRGRFSDMPFHSRYENWTGVPDAFLRFARKEKIQGKWKDVLGMIGAQAGEGKGSKVKVRASHGRSRKQDIFQDRPLYGPLMNLPEMVHEPLNELGVVFAFGMVARQLGFKVLRLQSAFSRLRGVAGGGTRAVAADET
jgi:hypothetical protein